MVSTRRGRVFDPRRTDDELRDWLDWILTAVATCLGAVSVALGLWLTAIGMAIVTIAAATRLHRRRTLRSGTTPEP